jgi:L-tartrate/succinate antiporter
VLLGVVNWGDILKDGPAWNTLAWFATLVAMADGLSKVGFIAWIAKTLSSQLSGFSTETVLIVLLCVYFFSHYLFASVTAHVTAMLPVILSTAAAMPGVSIGSFALMLVLANGLMGVLTPYGTGPSPVYASSGYIPSSDFWRLGLIFGSVYLAVCLMFLGPLTV